MTWPAPTRQDHEKFCATEGWTPVRDATYEIGMPDGRVLRTRISHPPDRSAYGPSLWGHVLRDQLDVSEREFWACVRDGTRPARGVPEVPPEALPAELVQLLTTRVGLADGEVRALTKAEAIERLNRYWATGSR